MRRLQYLVLVVGNVFPSSVHTFGIKMRCEPCTRVAPKVGLKVGIEEKKNYLKRAILVLFKR